MQSVVTGQAPITLERKITSGGKQNKKRIAYTGASIAGKKQNQGKATEKKGVAAAAAERNQAKIVLLLLL